MISLWMVPSIVALLIKSALLFHPEIKKQTFLLAFIGTFFLLNLLEVIGFFRSDFDYFRLKLYYATAVFCLFYLVSASAIIAQRAYWLKKDVFLIFTTVFAAFILFTDYIILGVSVLGNGSITRIPGSYYSIFQLYTLGMLGFALVLLGAGILKCSDHEARSRSLMALLSFLPSMLVIFAVLALMQLGYRVNMVGFLSLSSCFMFLVFVPLSNKKALFNTMKYIPFTRERSSHIKFERLMKKFEGPLKGDDIDIKNLFKELEAHLIDNTNLYFSSQKEVAQILNMSESTLSRKVDK